MLIALPACNKEDDNKAATKQAVAPPPPPPSPLENIKLDPRVEFPNAMEPSTTAIAQGVASLASAIVNGNTSNFRDMLAAPDQAVLASLSESGDWKESTEGIELARVVALNETDLGDIELGLAIQAESGAYLLAWRGSQTSGSWTFTAMPITSKTADNARDLDGIDLGSLADASLF